MMSDPNQSCCETHDAYRESFKYFKNFSQSRRNLQVKHSEETINGSCKSEGHADLLSDILLPCPDNGHKNSTNKDERCVLRRKISCDSHCQCYQMWGLRPPESWSVAELTFPQGLLVIKNPFTPMGQRYWIARTLLNFPHDVNYITNMDNLNRLHKMKKGESVTMLSDFKLDVCSLSFYINLRWVTFGYHHDWDTKVYSEDRRSKFPEDLADMTRYISQILGFSNFEAEAAIANYYHMDSTLSGHVDRSEVNQDAPLFSFSFGQEAIFLIGGKTKMEQPQPVLLQSGDIAIMSGASRLSYHGIPKILSACSKTWDVSPPPVDSFKTNEEGDPFYFDKDGCCKRIKLDDDSHKINNSALSSYKHDCNSFQTTINDHEVSHRLQNMKWTQYLENYICKSRINLNIRQVLFPGQNCLTSVCEEIVTK